MCCFGSAVDGAGAFLRDGAVLGAVGGVRAHYWRL